MQPIEARFGTTVVKKRRYHNSTLILDGDVMNRPQYILNIIAMTAMLWLPLKTVDAQTFDVTVQNQIALAGSIFEFDIYVQRTGVTDWKMADATFQFTYNSGAFTSTAITYVVGSTQLGAGYVIAPDVNIPVRLNIEIQSPTSYASATTISPTGTRVGTFRVTTISNVNAMADLAWRTPLTTKQAMVERLANDNTAVITSGGTYIAPSNTPLPITLAAFTGGVISGTNHVRLNWTTLSEINNYGFMVQRRAEGDSLFADLPNGFVPGNGTTTEPHDYMFIDSTLGSAGRYHYRLRQIDLDGSSRYSTGIVVDFVVLSVIENAPREFKLTQNYPNPFNPETQITFSVENSGPASLQIYNIIGQHVATLFEDNAEAGRYYTLRVNGKGLASGIYLYRLQSGKKSDLKKMLLVK